VTWAPGQSGNPKGRQRSPGVLEMVRKAREHVPAAIDTAVKLLGNDDGKTALAAATFLRDTGMGKPSQVEFDLAQVSDDELAAEVTRRAGLRRADEERSGVAAAALDAH
jgi:hypothetical protein